MPGYFPEPYVANVKTPDFSRTMENVFAAKLMQGRNEDMQRSREADNIFAEGMQQGKSPTEAANYVRQRGYGDKSLDYEAKAQANVFRDGTLKTQRAELLDKAHKYLLLNAGLATNQQEWDSMINQGERDYGMTAPEPIRTYSPELQRRLATAGLTGVQQIEMEFKRAQEARAQTQEGRSAALFPGQVAQQGATLEHTQGAEKRAQELQPAAVKNAENKGQKIIMVTDPDGFTKVPHVYDPATGEAHPVQVAPQGGDDSAGVAAPQAEVPPYPGAKKAPDGKWYVQQNGKWFGVD